MTKQIDWAEKVKQYDREVVLHTRMAERAKARLEKADLRLAEQVSQFKPGNLVRLKKQLKEHQVLASWMVDALDAADTSVLSRYSPKATSPVPGVVEQVRFGCRLADPKIYIDLLFDPVAFTVIGTVDELHELLEKV
jgi:hypothetical protein